MRPITTPEFAIGLMSGTSADGIDAALVRLEECAGRFPRIELEKFLFVPFTSQQRARIFSLFSPTASIVEVEQMDSVMGEWFGEAVNRLIALSKMSPRNIRVIGSHGQTIAHYPPGVHGHKDVRGFTRQLGCPSTIAAVTGLDVVADFRSKDMALGGQGAPLIPYCDYAFFHSHSTGRVILNIGGIANVTLLPAGCELDAVVGFDTGPGNMVLDGLIQLLTEGDKTYDQDGAMASQGTVRPDLLNKWLKHPYFRLQAPKSTGREEFGLPFCELLLQDVRQYRLSPENAVRTATAFVAETIVQGIARSMTTFSELIVSGGGIHNQVLIEELRDRLTGVQIIRSNQYGIPDDAKEAMAFAYMAWQFLHGRPTNIPRVTGASRATSLGSFTPGTGYSEGRKNLR